MQIVPAADGLIVEAKIRPADITQICPGLEASIRFDAFDYTISGAVSGKVSYVSADTLKEETKAGETAYYRVHVGIGGPPVVSQTGKTLQILLGMTARVSIRTGRQVGAELTAETVARDRGEGVWGAVSWRDGKIRAVA